MQEFTLRISEDKQWWHVEVRSASSLQVSSTADVDLLSALTNCLPAIVDNCVEDFPWSAIDGRSA